MFDAGQVARFASEVHLERPFEPDEMAPLYVFLASNDSSSMTGQALHPNGGEVFDAGTSLFALADPRSPYPSRALS